MAGNKIKRRVTRLIIRARIAFRKNKSLFLVYLILRTLVIGMMILQLLNRNYWDVFLCVLTLVLFMIPSFVEKRIKIDVPNALEITILLFIFAAEILGEISEYYVNFQYWDTMLHTVNGFLCAAIGFSMINILNDNEKFGFNASPLFAALVALCFSMTIGVLWEFFEFSMDQLFGTDMQKDTVITVINSVVLNPSGKNNPFTIVVESVAVNGDLWDIGGYLDIGLIDTMLDLFVNFIGAVIFSTLGYFYAKRQRAQKFMRRILPSKINHESAGRKAEENYVSANIMDNDFVSPHIKDDD